MIARKSVFVSVMLVLTLFMAAGCGKPRGRPAITEVPVVGYKVKAAPLEETISVVGTLEAKEIVEIRSERAAKVEKIGFEEGQKVKKGELLIELDRAPLQAELVRAQADLELALRIEARYAALAGTNAVSRQDVDQAVAAAQTKQAAVDIIKAGLGLAVIKAPFDGVIAERRVSIGQFTEIGTHLTTLIDDTEMKAEFNVPERYLADVSVGQVIHLTVAAYPKEVFSGDVYFVGPQVDALTRTVLMKARVANSRGLLRRGMFADLRLVTRVRDNAIMIPESALMLQGKSASVYVVNSDGKAELRQVTPGIRLAGKVEIVSGISAGETVITEGSQKVFPGVTAVVRYEEQR